MHLQRNATQRNAYQNYILLLTNNFKFYILQILGHLNFLSVFFVLAKNQFASLNNNAAHAVCRWQAHCVNISEKSTQGGSIRLTSPQECACRWQAHCVNNSEISMQGVTIPCYSEFAFSYALKNQFEIISRNENYAFNHNNFYHNGNNRIWRLPLLLAKGTPTETKSRNDDFIVCNNGLLSLNNDLFSRNDYGGNFIFGFWSNFNFGFLFNRKINSKKILFQKEKKR